MEEFNTYLHRPSTRSKHAFLEVCNKVSFQGDNPGKVRYNANSIRNFWERLWIVIKTKVSDGITEAHFAPTAHIEKTAREKYLHRNGTEEERAHELHVYSDRLANRREDEGSLSEKSSQAHLMTHSWTRIWRWAVRASSTRAQYPQCWELHQIWSGTGLSAANSHTSTTLTPYSDCAATASRTTLSTNASRPTKTSFMELTQGVTGWYSGHQAPHFDDQLQNQIWSSRMERGFQEGLLVVQRRTKFCLWVGDKEEMRGGWNPVERRRVPENLYKN